MSEPWLELGYDMDTYYKEMHVAKKLKELEKLKKVMNLVKENLITIDTSLTMEVAKKHMIKNTIKIINKTEKESITL